MRIIGGHDYYDSAQAYGHDPNIVFVRGNCTLNENAFERPYTDLYFLPPDKVKKESHWKAKFYSINTKNGKWEFRNIRVIFCGILYNGIKAEYRNNRDYSIDTQIFWNRDEFTKWVTENFKDTVPIYKDVRAWREYDNQTLMSNILTGNEYDSLINNRVSIAIYNPFQKEWNINCTGLKELQFYRVFKAVDAFQELDMWMSGALGLPGNQMVEVSDDIRMLKHGMDKWSFRKKVR
jgi:hypothetical protein